MRFYKYIIYRLYTWRLEAKDRSPGTTVALTMASIHVFQLLLLYAIITRMFPSIDISQSVTRINGLIFVAMFYTTYYLIFYNKKRWDEYIKEFKNESPPQKKRGALFVRIYAFGSVILYIILVIIFILLE